MRTILFSEQTGLSAKAEFPATGKDVQEVCDKLGIANVAQAEVKVEAVNFLNFEMKEEIFVGKTFVLDELNYLSKQLSLLMQTELDVFAQTALAEDFSMREMIELTVNTHNMELVDNKPDMVLLAERLALSMNPDLEENDFDFSLEEASKFLSDFSRGQESQVAEDGRLLYRGDDWEEFFTRNTLPETNYDMPIMSVDLIVRGREYQSETLCLPYHESELQKSLERLGVTSETEYSKLEMKLYECNVEDTLHKFLCEQKLTTENLGYLNQVAESLGEIYFIRSKELSNLLDLTQISDLEDLATLSENLDDISFHSHIESPKDYGESLLEEALDYDFSICAEDYIDFDGYGRAKLEKHDHIFTESGLLIYHGNNPEMSEIMMNAEEQTMKIGGMQ